MATLAESQALRMTGQSASMIAWAVSMHWLYMRGSTYSIARQVIIALRDMIPSLVHEMDAQVGAITSGDSSSCLLAGAPSCLHRPQPSCIFA